MLWIKVDKVDGFCTRQSTVLSCLLRLSNYISRLYAIICGILLPRGIRDTRNPRKEWTDSSQPSILLLPSYSHYHCYCHSKCWVQAFVFVLGGVKVRASFIFICQEEKASSNKKPIKIKCFYPWGEDKGENTLQILFSLLWFHNKEKCHKVEQHR